MKELHSDILIIGGGLTGLMTAYALSPLKKNIIIIDKFDFGITKDANADLRTTAIAEGSKIFFEKINIWPQFSKYAEPIKYIKVVDRTENRKINFYNKNIVKVGIDPLVNKYIKYYKKIDYKISDFFSSSKILKKKIMD